MNIGDWAGNFFTGDWTNAYEESPMLTVGVPAALATAGFGAAGMGPLAGLFGAGEAATGAGVGLGEAAGGGGFLESLFGGGGLEGTLGESLLSGGEGAGYAGGGLQDLLGMGGGGWDEAGFAAFNPTDVGSAVQIGGGGGGTGTASGGSGNFLSGMLSGAKDQIMKNPLGSAAAAVGLGSAFMGGGTDNSPERQKLQSLAERLGPQGQQLMNYLSTGTLPPGLQAKLDQATSAAKARIISNHAKNGQSTDPSMNSALAQELNGVDINAVAAMAQSQIQMMETGLRETGLSSQLYEMLMKMDRQDNKDLMDSIAKFAAALGGSSGSMKKAA